MMSRITVASGVLVAVFALAGCATMGDAPIKYANGIMADNSGMTLYTFDKDPAGTGKSVCNDKCAVLWPPLKASSDSASGGDFSVIKRNDGSLQWAYRGKPLYRWVKDQKPGDRTGDGVNGVWHVVREPAGGSMRAY
jgi:predicted lipoprotein with Yx(FWY)xxD motif